VSFQAQYQAFVRFCGRARRSSLKPSRSIDLRFGTFHSGRALAFRELWPPPAISLRGIYGASNPGPMLWAERSRSGGIFQEVFLHANWALSRQFSAPYRPWNARQVGFGRVLAH
jgi:hypothetical protein